MKHSADAAAMVQNLNETMIKARKVMSDQVYLLNVEATAVTSKSVLCRGGSSRPRMRHQASSDRRAAQTHIQEQSGMSNMSESAAEED